MYTKDIQGGEGNSVKLVQLRSTGCSFYRLEEGGVLTDCSIRTQEPEETLDFNFSSANVINKIIMKVSVRNLLFDSLFKVMNVLKVLNSCSLMCYSFFSLNV